MTNPDKFVFIATGGMLPPETIDFSHMAVNRMVSLVNTWNALVKKKSPPFSLPATVRFIHFNFDSGAVLMHDHTFPDKGIKLPSRKPGDWTPVPSGGSIVTTLHDNNNNENNTKTLSITNIYESVRQSPDGSVLEVSFFSHAFVRGPVLINTSDDPSSPNRADKDMDGRARTDFNPNMGDASAGNGALNQFIKKFDKAGHFRVYGCNVQDVVGRREIVGNIAASGAVRNSNVVTITTTAEHGQDPGQRVEISGVPDASFNARFTISSVPSTTTFTFSQTGTDATSGPGIVATSGRDPVGKITNGGAERKSKTVTITTAADHKLEKGQPVLISDVPDTSFNGRFAIRQVPSSTQFAYFQNAADATSGPGAVSTPGGSSYKRSGAYQLIDQAFWVPSRQAGGASLRSGKAPTGDVVLDMWVEVMNEAERDVVTKAKEKARAQGKSRSDQDKIGAAAWAATPAKERNKLANGLLIMHRQLDPDFYPEPNTTDSTVEPAQKTVTKSWAAILGMLSKKISDSYIFKAADKLTASGITCHGAVPGAGGNNEPDTRDLGLMRVCDSKSFGCETSFGPWLQFYKLFFFVDTSGQKLATAFDDRNYLQLDSDAVAIVKARATP